MRGSKRTRAMLGIAAAMLLAMGAHNVAAQANPAEPSPFALGGPFSLVDHDGRPRSDRDFRGTFMLVFFGYANCRGMCPVGLPHMTAAVDALGEMADMVQPVFISVDPGRDTPGALRDFVRKFHPRLVGLTGPAARLRAVARSYRAEAKVIGRFPDGSPIFSHGTYIYLVGPDGNVLTLFPPVMESGAMAAAIRRYIPAHTKLN